MYKFHIDNMVNDVADKLRSQFEYLNSLTGRSEKGFLDAIRAGIEKEWKDKIAVTWCVEDIHSLAWDFHGRKISDKDAWDILQNIFNHFDAERGINWDEIESWIDSYFEGEKEEVQDEHTA